MRSPRRNLGNISCGDPENWERTRLGKELITNCPRLGTGHRAWNLRGIKKQTISALNYGRDRQNAG